MEINNDKNIENSQINKLKCEQNVEISCKSLLDYYGSQNLDIYTKNNKQRQQMNILENMMNQNIYNQ